MFAGIYYWYPKATGRRLSRTLGRWHFWLFLIGFHLTFDPQTRRRHPRHAAPDFHLRCGRGWEIYNLVSSAGAVFQVAGLLCLVANLVLSLRHGERAGDDPWDAWTLEWATTSPPSEYNFERLPEVHSRRPLWT